MCEIEIAYGLNVQARDVVLLQVLAVAFVIGVIAIWKALRA